MTFERTKNGISNLAAFYRVKAVVFVEGGRNFDDEGYSVISLDIAFWGNIFSVISPNLKYKFRAVGAKSDLIYVAQQIVENNIASAYVAMDRDHDTFTGKIIEHRRIFYTHGYSWENDLLTVNTIREIFYTFCPVCRETVDPSEDIEHIILDFSKKMYWPVYADILLTEIRAGLIDTRSPGRIFEGKVGSAPRIKRNVLIESLQHINKRRKRRGVSGKSYGTNPVQHCKGKIIGHCAYLLVMHLIRKYGGTGKSRIDKPPFYGAAIAALRFALEHGTVPGIERYYRQLFRI